MKYSQAIEKLLNQLERHDKGTRYSITLYPHSYTVKVKRYKEGVDIEKGHGIEDVINITDARELHIHEYQGFIEEEVFGYLVDDFKKGKKK